MTCLIERFFKKGWLSQDLTLKSAFLQENAELHPPANTKQSYLEEGLREEVDALVVDAAADGRVAEALSVVGRHPHEDPLRLDLDY